MPPGARTSVRTYSVTAPVASVVINGGAGAITVTGSERATVQVTERLHYSKTPPPTRHAMAGSTLTLSYTCPIQLDCGVGYEVLVPRGVSVRAVNRVGSVVLTSISGPVTVQTIAGAVTATSLGSPSASLKSNAGSVTASFSAVPASIQASTSAGSVTLIVPGSVAYRVSAHTHVGSATVTVRQSASSDHKITASSGVGSVTITPPS